MTKSAESICSYDVQRVEGHVERLLVTTRICLTFALTKIGAKSVAKSTILTVLHCVSVAAKLVCHSARQSRQCGPNQSVEVGPPVIRPLSFALF